MSLPPPHPDQAVLITGASAGIGEQLARQLAERGHHLIVVARREDKLRELAEELRVRHGVRVEVQACDLAKRTARARLIAAVNETGLEVAGLCNNAGFGTFGRFWELPAEREAEEIKVNVVALHELTRTFLPPMVERGDGAVLNVGSLAGFQPQPCNATYAATKAFVNSFSEALHTELAGTGVSCTVLTPGPVKTEFADRAGIGHLSDFGPGFLWATAEEVARTGIEAMYRGRRTAMPKASDRLTASAGRIVPRSVFLPVARRVIGRGLRSS
jgi:short-subunit dehydrogenase